MEKHTLKDKRTIAILSPHEYKFSDGTVSFGSSISFVKRLRAKIKFVPKVNKKVKATKMVPFLNAVQVDELKDISASNDIVLASNIFITALENIGVREEFKNVVFPRFKKRNKRTEKIVDIDCFGY